MIDSRLQLESAVLGGLLRFPKVWDDLQLVADYFDDALNQLIFGRIQVLRDSGVVPDVLLVNAGLDVRGVVRVFECADLAPLSDVACKFHVNQLKAMWAKSELKLAGNVLAQKSDDPAMDVSGLVSDACLLYTSDAADD